MDYAGFRRFRDGLLGDRSPLRLDCMNPVRALAPAGWPPPAAAPASAERALEAWRRATGASETLVPGRGVRDLLGAALRAFGNRDLWIPADVYPAYGEIARSCGLDPRTFETLPMPDWDFLPRASAVLLPVPLTPLGRLPDEEPLRWLEGSADRHLIVDAVYTYDFAACRALLAPWMATGRTVVLWSCSKSWLLPDALGVAEGSLAPLLRGAAEPAAGTATAALGARPALPRLQQQAFHREWERLAPRLCEVDPAWRPPATGYFSTIGAAFGKLLDRHGILAVPASVFGSAREDLSIVTCLHDIGKLPS